MSNNSNSSGVGIPASSALFLIVALVIGAAVLFASTTIDPRSGVRAQFTATPIDLFANITYIPFSSSDGVVQFERPAAWTEISTQQPLTYVFAPVNPDGTSSDISRFDVILGPVTAIGLPGITANSTPEDVIGALVSSSPDAQASDLVPEKIDNLSGASVRFSQVVSNQGVNEQRVAEFVVLSLGDGYIVLFEAITTGPNSERMNGVMQHLKDTFKLNRDAALASLKNTYPATTVPMPTLAPSVTPAASSATAEATVAVTAESTTEVTAEATAEATATPTQ